MNRRSLVLILLTALIPGAAASAAGGEEGEILLPGAALERSIAGGETHAYSVATSDVPLLVVVEQRGIDLIVEVRGATGQVAMTADAPNVRWGPEVLLLSPGVEGGFRIEIRPGQRSVPPGRYTLRSEALEATADRDPRVAALAAMSRAGQLPYSSAGERRQALIVYQEALAAWRSLGESRWEAEALNATAALKDMSGEIRAAAEGYSQSQALWHQLAEPYREAASLRSLGIVRLQSEELAAARQALEQSLALWRSLGERFEEGGAQSDLCLAEHTGGALPAALACYEEVRTLFHDLGDGSQEARILNNIGGVYDLMAEPDAALERYQQALILHRALQDRRREAQTLNNIAEIHRALGEWQEALRGYDEMREILQSLGDQSLEATLLSNLGFTYNNLGEPQRALGFLQEALKLRRALGDRRNEVITLNLGSLWRGMDDLDKAFEYHQKALELAVALKDARQEAVTGLGLAEVLLDRGDVSAALQKIGSALPYLRKTGMRHGEAQALALQGRALTRAGRAQEALPVLQEALAQRRTQRDLAGVAEALYALAVAERAMGLREEAKSHTAEAMAQVEDLRAGFVSPDLRAAFLATRRRIYSLTIDLLMDQHAADPRGGYDRAALEVSERIHARSLLDALQGGNIGHAGSAVPAAMIERRQSLRRRLSAKADQQLKQEGPKAESLEGEIQHLLAELDGVEAEIRQHDPRYAAFGQPRSLQLEEIAALLDPGTLLLEYSLGEERSFLWAISKGVFRSFTLPSQRKIEDQVRRVYQELSTVESGTRRSGQEVEALSRSLLEPVWSEAKRAHRLVIVLDGALHVLPFGALRVPDPGKTWASSGGGQPLLDRLEVVYLPSAATLALQRERLERRSPAPKWAAVLADPVFSPQDPRLTRTPIVASQLAAIRSGGPGVLLPAFERLPSSRREADAIASLAPVGKVWTALAFDASRETVLSDKLQSYRVLHFATHGVADTRNPERSGLVLSLVDAAGEPRQGFLGLTDIYDLDLGADLVVLSGCQTALGKQVRGEGLMGITRGFLYAGVPRVVASLWKVQDRTTAELMHLFYRAMWRDHLSPAAALRKAQQSLRRDPRYRAPYSWAGFVLQGDWR
jgi:CHAT domain-containing protein/tetratricopeptide (TPR) repeat protein